MKRYARVFGYLKQYKLKIFLYCIFILLSIVFSIISIGMIMPFLTFLFDEGNSISMLENMKSPIIQWVNQAFKTGLANYGKTAMLGIVCLFIILSIILKNVFIFLSYYILNPLKNKVVNNLRDDMYAKILSLPIGYFTERRKGDIISRMSNDVGEVETSVVGTLEGWFRDPVTIIGYLVVLLVMSPELTVFILVALPIMGLIIGQLVKSLKRQGSEAAIKLGEVFSVLDETLVGLRVIKAFNVEKRLNAKYVALNERLLTIKNKMGYKRDLASPLSEVLGVTVFCVILYFGGSLILSGKIALTGKDFLGYMAMFFGIISPAKALSVSFSNMQRGAAAIARIEEVLKAPVVVDANENGKTLRTFDHSIEFKNVNFYYDDIAILKNINLKIEKGKTVALVGSSGAGKSTLADLVPRFHDCTSGEILIDGVNIKDYKLTSVRNQISIVTQEPILFNDTIANNIALGMNDASQQAIEQAAQVANAHNFIIKKEESYQSNIGDRGTKLSGGERQRLTIARAVLKNPPILILDEATSSLDTESEKLVQDAINNMMQNRTSIVIAHRLSTIRHADEIIVLQKGEIVERGTHDQLLAAKGFYNRLVTMQEVK